jgi:hypothetical protein
LVLLSQLSIGSIAIAYVSVPVLFAVPARWLPALPVSPRMLFRITTVPLVLAVAAASVIRIFADPEHPMTPRTRIVQVAEELAILYLLIFLCEVLNWRRLSTLGRWVRAIPLAVMMVIPITMLMVFSRSHGFWIIDEALQRLAGALPENWRLLAPVLILPVALLYWLAEHTFGELEYPNIRATVGEPG